jgi:3-deoxy-7-phosphoheptulonate synthase
MKTNSMWNPNSWATKTCAHQTIYPDQSAVAAVVDQLSTVPPVITALEAAALKNQLAEAALGKRFLLQGGDCAESFADCNSDSITNKLKILLQMSLILLHGLHKPIIRVGRMAGQYAKPRSTDTETQNNISLPSYRGDIINRAPFTPEDRTPNPQLMLQGYFHSIMTLNYIRALVDGGFANLLHPEYWQLDFVKHSPLANEYQIMVNSLRDSIDFLKTIAGLQLENLNRVDFFTSHEALLLPYEQALTRQAADGRWYNLSTHFPWIGMRTAQVDGAHVEYMRGIANPIAVKIGPAMTSEWLTQLLEILNPHNEAGRLTLIVRMGAKNIKEKLPQLIDVVKKSGITVLWSCDPMHGNTDTTQDGIKTRRFDDVLSELQDAFQIHQQCGTYLGGVHFELTGDDVTECTGGARGLSEEDLKRAYKSLCDPRLNYEQALEMAMLIVRTQR